MLAAGLLVPLAGCTGAAPDPSPSPSPKLVDPDVALRAAAVERERGLLAAYDEALAADPSRATLLAPLRAEHAAHLGALEVAAMAPPSTSPDSSSRPGAAAVRTATARLRSVERRAAAEHAADALPASRALAQLLASLAAAEAAHAVALA